MSEGERRVLHIVTQREPAGAQRVAHHLCEGFRERGVKSDVWFLFRRHPAYENAGYRDICESRPGPFGTLVMLVRLTAAMKSWRPDAVIGHTHHANVFSCLAAAMAGVPRRTITHHTLCAYESRARRALLAVLRWCRVFNDEIYVSESTRASYGPSAGSRGCIIYNGVDDQGEPRSWSDDPRADSQSPLVVSVGRLVAQKDHETLVRSMVDVPDVTLAILGEGDLRAELVALITALDLDDRVALMGNVDPSDVRSALAAADVAALPSVWEAFPMVVLESLAAGTPMVVSDIPAHREALAEAALYHPVADHRALAEQINAVLRDESVGQKLAVEMHERRGLFTLDVMADAYLTRIWPKNDQDPASVP